MTEIDWVICAPPVGNQQRITIQSSTDSVSPKNAVAPCPSPLKLYAMGAEITNGQGNVVLDVDSGLTQANAGAYEISSLSDSWSILSHAICGDASPNMTHVAQSRSSNGRPLKIQSSDECPTGTVLHGMGGEITVGLGQALIEFIKPWPTVAPGTVNDIRAVEAHSSSVTAGG